MQTTSIETSYAQPERSRREEEARSLLASEPNELVRRYLTVCSLYQDDLADRLHLEEDNQRLREENAEQFEELTQRATYIAELEGKLTTTTIAAIGMVHELAQPKQTCTHCQQLEERYGCSINDLLGTTAKMVPLAAYLKVQQERDHWKQEAEAQTIAGLTLADLRAIWRTKQLNTTQKLALPFFVEALQNSHQPLDQEGRRRINCGTIADQIGTDASTISRVAQFCKTQLPHLFDIESHPEHVPGVKKPVDRIYGKEKDPTILKRPNDIIPLQPRNQGGDRYTGLRCNKCESERYEVIRKTKTTDVFHCLECDHRTVLNESEKVQVLHIQGGTPDGTPTTNKKQLVFYSDQGEDEKILTSEANNLQAVITSEGGQDATEHLTDDNQMAAQLLLECAGMEQAHILMMEEGEDKYKFRDGPLTLQMLLAHLEGRYTYGASLEYPDGTTRMTLRDADSVADIEVLRDAARRLAEAGYSPLLEYSPVPARDGKMRRVHLILIYSDLVNAEAALRREQEIVPELEQIREYWPNPRAHQRVRLPGGRYTRPGYGQWCELFGVEGESASDGAAARLLLASITPASLVPALPVIIDSLAPTVLATPQVDHQGEPSTSEDVHQGDSLAPTSVVGQQELTQGERAGGLQDDQSKCDGGIPRWCLERAGLAGDVREPEVDTYWANRYGSVATTTYYFAVMPGYAAGEYNKEHPLEEVHPLESNGMAMSPNGPERTASTSYHKDRFYDHSLHGRRPDGTRDSGDALELASKVKNTSKPELLSMTTSQIARKATNEMEAAARAGQPLPTWLEYPVCIITRAGRRRYAKLLAEAIRVPVDHPQTEEQNGQRRAADKLGEGSNLLQEYAGDRTGVSASAREDHRGSETDHSSRAVVRPVSDRRDMEDAGSHAGDGVGELCGESGEDHRGAESNDRLADTSHTDTWSREPAASQPDKEDGSGHSHAAASLEQITEEEEAETVETVGIPPYEPLPEISEGTELASQRFNVACNLLAELGECGLELQCLANGLHAIKQVAQGSKATGEKSEEWEQTIKQYYSELVDILGETPSPVDVPEESSAPSCESAGQVEASHKIGTCAACGSTRWFPHPELEYFCAKCYEPIAYTRAIKARRSNPFS